eukprot:jgi/Botrbrau1/19794/Bobra.0124s0042.1
MPWKGVYAPPPPENFDPEDPYKDPVALTEHRLYLMREKAVKVEKAKILREKLKECYITEGVNFIQECKPLALAYLASIRGASAAANNNYANDVPTVGTYTPRS